MKIEWNKVTWYSKLVAVILFVTVFYTGIRLGEMREQTRTFGDYITVPQFMIIAECTEGDLNSCFGSGRTLYSETRNATIWELISAEESTSFGMLEKSTGNMYFMNIN